MKKDYSTITEAEAVDLTLLTPDEFAEWRRYHLKNGSLTVTTPAKQNNTQESEIQYESKARKALGL